MRSTKLGFRDEPVAIKCLRCAYGWKTRTKKKTCSCPDCRYPNNTEAAIKNASSDQVSENID